MFLRFKLIFIIKKLRPKTLGRSVISALPPKLCIKIHRLIIGTIIPQLLKRATHGKVYSHKDFNLLLKGPFVKSLLVEIPPSSTLYIEPKLNYSSLSMDLFYNLYFNIIIF